jgi:uncharacterized tellurite resistance protein B-like protein
VCLFASPLYCEIVICSAFRRTPFRFTSNGGVPFEGVSMLDLLKEFLADVGLGEKPASRFDENDYRLAAAALLIHVSMIDGVISPGERDALHAVLKREFNLDDAATDELIAAATEADREAVDLYAFTSLLNRSLDEDGRRRMVEMMWRIVFADGRMNEFEDNIVWRAADLLGISTRERVEMRQSVSADSKVPGGV